ncbi:MAG: LmbE family protein [Berkelbacteria bacterium GW2011_GWA1_39_10]|uniref:LmbE family protein n=1 Tax=Berkelbacteria bacterium GW2011_GWA1_39_10 TaxID=1618332 RepID=A0A0G0LIQ8_9BACT|nr:MAG: LmbE family protein [Berkelbacteria bacterium GW2011_GWA1_39_10]
MALKFLPMSKVKKLFLNRKIQIVVIVLSLFFVPSFIYASFNHVLPQSAIYLLDNINVPQKGDKLLVFSPHPDDETIGVGGYIIEATKREAIVKIILVTDGNKQGKEVKRYEEFRKATSILGVKNDNLVFLDLPDGKLRGKDEVLLDKLFKDQIDDFEPNYIAYPHPLDIHPDHSVTGQIVEKVIKNNSKVTAYKYLIHDYRYPQPKKYRPNLFLLPPVDVVTNDKQWKRLLLSDDDLKLKEKAISQYHSQLRVPFLRSLILSLVRKNELFATMTLDE